MFLGGEARDADNKLRSTAEKVHFGLGVCGTRKPASSVQRVQQVCRSDIEHLDFNLC